MKKNLTSEYIYMIGNSDIGEQEIFFQESNSFNPLDYYMRVLEVYPELVHDYNLKIGRDLPEQLAKNGIVIYENDGKVSEILKNDCENLDYYGYLYLPKELTTIQKELLKSRLNEFKNIFLELIICSENEIKYVTKKNNEYTAYQKLKKIINKR